MSTKNSTKVKKVAPLSSESQKLFEKYYIEFRQSLYWYIYRKVNKSELAEDMTADVFMKLLKNPHIIDERKENEVKAWLYTVARNQVIDYYRKTGGSVKKVEMEEEIFEIVNSDEDDHLETLSKDEDNQVILAAIESLDPQEQEVIHLRFREDLKFSEIAEVLGKNEGAVKMMLYRSLEKLKEMTGERIGLSEGS